MSCKCHKDKTGEYITPPNTICLYCAEKHLATALAVYADDIAPQHRALVLGELNCARLHMTGAYPNESERLKWIIVRLMQHVQVGHEELATLCLDVSGRVAQLTNNSDMQERRYIGPALTSGYTGTRQIAELCAATAWRLMAESGYLTVNKPMAVGNLVWAQICAETFDKDLVQDLRTMRHRFQTGEDLVNDPEFFRVRERLAEAAKQGQAKNEDFDWYLDI